ncbi:GDNF family receptor alpha-4-like isoform X2 [Phycodurus eques]|uniref:GDNF family receptor alpha-4-like isoform X2 n=1 Tax=Phycodurus eques TaxID=693459 RepID=UPI002ACEBC79|nr:GDNF family receptor alpha-4-like isoform X2 [Phycodurus eques]
MKLCVDWSRLECGGHGTNPARKNPDRNKAPFHPFHDMHASHFRSVQQQQQQQQFKLCSPCRRRRWIDEVANPQTEIHQSSKKDRRWRNYIQESLGAGIIRPASSPAGAGLLFTQKTDKTPGPCADYRGVLPFSVPNVTFSAFPTDCVEAHHVCTADPQCEELYQGLELCTDKASVSPIGEQAVTDCLRRQDALLTKHPSLLACKCDRGFRKEKQCVQIYWRVRLLPGEDELETSPYENTQMDSGTASLVAGDVENQCLKAAQDCGLYEKCGALRSEYVLACTKKVPGTHRCNQHKCHRALRRFMEKVPKEYSFGVLFCPCTNTLCGERRRKTIVPSCAYDDMEGLQPNCLHQQSFCRRDALCRSRFADFIQNCEPSPRTTSGCLRDSAGLCLRAYAGLVGTIMTPNYIGNDSAAVSLSCNCQGSGNQWQECLRLRQMFSHNICLRNSISWMGSAGSLPGEITPLPAPGPSPLVQEDAMLTDNHLPDRDIAAEHKDEEESIQIQAIDEGGQFEVIPQYSERATVTNLGPPVARGAMYIVAAPLALLLLYYLSAFFCHTYFGIEHLMKTW